MSRRCRDECVYWWEAGLDGQRGSQCPRDGLLPFVDGESDQVLGRRRRARALQEAVADPAGARW